MIDFKSDQEMRVWLDKNFPVGDIDLDEETVKTKFIENFGEEKYKEFVFTTELDNAGLKVCKLLGIPYIPFFFDNIPEDGRYVPDLDCFIISKKHLYNWIESLKSLIHELKHSHQRYCVEHKGDKNLKYAPKELIEIWEEELSVDEKSIPFNERMSRGIEIDAYAFTKFALDILFNEKWHHFDPFTDEVFTVYAYKYFYGKLK